MTKKTETVKVMFDIEIKYKTGNSFGLHERTEMLGNPVSNFDDAKENLQRIKNHYKKHNDSPDFDEDYELNVLIDDGERTITPFWIGYFEELLSAKIVLDEGLEDISFDAWDMMFEE